LFEEEIVDQLQGRFRTGLGDRREIITQTEGQLVERQEMDVEESVRLVTRE
jgi:hypothetical protein